MKLDCPTLTKAQLVTQFKSLGLFFGDTVMVHASLRAVGNILGGPDVLIDAIMETIGHAGNMMMYIGCQSPFDDVGRGVYTPEEEKFIRQNCPMFEPHKMRASRDFGALAEIFRTHPGTVASQNPGCRMAALGSRADWIVSNHPLFYGFGKDTPYEKLCNMGGKLMLIGSDHDNVTLLHHAEAVAPIPNKKVLKITLPVLHYEKFEWFEIEDFDSSIGVRNWPDNFFADIVGQFIESTKLAPSQVGQAETFVLDAKKLVDFSIPKMVDMAQQMDSSNQNC